MVPRVSVMHERAQLSGEQNETFAAPHTLGNRQTFAHIMREMGKPFHTGAASRMLLKHLRVHAKRFVQEGEKP